MQKHLHPVCQIKKLKCLQKPIFMPIMTQQSQSLLQKEIKPISIVYSDKLSNCKRPQKFAVKAYKNLSRLTASGEFTSKKLKVIKKAPLKLVKRFEFDPFLSDHSEIKPLLPVLKRVKTAKSVNLVIRRVEVDNESNLIAPFLCRFRRMKDIYVEFPSTKHIDGRGVKSISEGIAKCLSLESLNMNFILLPDAHPEDFIPFFGSLKILRLKKLTINKLCHHLKTSPSVESTLVSVKLPKMPLLKSLTLKKGSIPGWIDVTSNEEAHFPCYLGSISRATNMEHFTYVFEFFSFTTEILLAFAKLLPRFEKLRSLNLEFLACKLGDLEFMILLDGLEKCTQINHLTFKVIQSPNADEEHIIQIAKSISRMSNLEKFDLYFRGTTSFGRQQLSNQLSKIDNMNYSLTRKSVHLFREY